MHKSRDDHGRDEAREMNDLLPEGYGEPRPVLYGGGDEAAGIASRFTFTRRYYHSQSLVRAVPR